MTTDLREPAEPGRHADADGAAAAAIELLTARGAHEIPHPGGTLLLHLERVHALLGEWGARPALRLAGLCHAFYGTDGFATALGEATRREELAEVIGEEAEWLVHFYAGCDRDFSHPRLAGQKPVFRDRFTGARFQPPEQARRDFAELTAANELDVVRADPTLRARYGGRLLELFTSWESLLSEPARRAVQASLP
ncbi:DUF6817 domain-containing protein [Planomonospora corallina]|uniref:DUF6817 domain-containing protein n=1 Tax=Planomonospora corallina TaxID=1806052 RepID=A0ABV8IAI5_9ACTN